jgi:hypothetical protein
MNVEVTFFDGEKIFPNYEPQHLENLKIFYHNKVRGFEIKNFVIRNNSGNVVALGGRF